MTAVDKPMHHCKLRTRGITSEREPDDDGPVWSGFNIKTRDPLATAYAIGVKVCGEPPAHDARYEAMMLERSMRERDNARR